MSVVLAQWAAVALFLIPLVVVLVARARQDRAAWEVALDIPMTVAVDLLVVLLLTRIVRLEVAALVSRALWAGGGVWWIRRRAGAGDPPRRPEVLDRRVVLAVGLAAALGFLLSWALSRPYVIWDRELHIPVVSALRGQSLPFASAYDPNVTFHYHFTGDVLAALMQIFSGDVLHSSLGLSLAHDVMFTLIAATVALLMAAAGARAPHLIVLGVAAVLLSGPCVFRFGVGEPYLGYSYYALYIWGFRPHQHVAMLMFVGVTGALLVRGVLLRAGGVERQGLAPLVACMALLPVTDESSAGVLGLCLGLAWLVEPSILARTRREGALILGGLAVAFVGFNLLFGGSLAPGGPVQKMVLMAPRSPGVQQPPLPLSTWPGMVALIADALPIWTALVGIVALALAARAEDRRWRWLVAFVVALFAISTFGLTCVQMNNAPPESHRFFTASLFMTPLLGLLVLPRLRTGSLPWTSIVAGLVLGGLSTVLWWSHYSRGHATPEWYFQQKGKTNLHETNCREAAGARLGDRPRPTYIETWTFYSYVGCRPSFVGGRTNSYWAVKIAPLVGLPALQDLDREQARPDETIDAICPAGWAASKLDAVCSYAVTHAKCEPQGTDFVRCPLTPADRTALVGLRPAKR
jgi:hypothetical protein